MTKENSTKPAFVSEETGRGDGFLAATHVWESFALPPRAAELLLPPPPPPPPSTNQTLQPGGQTTAHMEITSANDGQQDYRNKPPTEMTHLVLIDIVFHLLNCGLIRSLTFLTQPTEPIIRVGIQKNPVYQFHMIDSSICLQPRQWPRPLPPFDPRTRRWGSSLVCFWSPQCPERAIRVWPLPCQSDPNERGNKTWKNMSLIKLFTG